MFSRLFRTWKGTSWEMSDGLSSFLAGGLASNMYWFSALRGSNYTRMSESKLTR